MDTEVMPEGRKPWPALPVVFLLLALLAALLLSLWRSVVQLQDDVHQQQVSLLAEQLKQQFINRLSSYELMLQSIEQLEESIRLNHTALVSLPVLQMFPELELFYGRGQGNSDQHRYLLHLEPLSGKGEPQNIELAARQQEQMRQGYEHGGNQAFWLLAGQDVSALMLMPLAKRSSAKAGVLAAKLDLPRLTHQLLGAALAERYQLLIHPVIDANAGLASAEASVVLEVQGQRWQLTISHLPTHAAFVDAALGEAYQRWLFAWIVILAVAGFLLWCGWQMRLSLARWQHADEENQRWQLGLEASPNMIILLDNQYRVIRLNHQAEQWLTPPNLQGMGPSIEIKLPEELCQWLSEVTGLANQRSLLNVADLQGTERALEVSYSRLQVADQHWFQLVINDVSHHVAVERSLREHVERLAQATRYKTEFLANLSHELRTPLNSILVLSHALKSNAQGNLTDKQVRHAGVIHHSGSVLLELINNLLELAKLDAGFVVARPERVQVVELLEAVEAKMRPKAQAKGLSLALVIEPEVPKVVCADRYCLQLMLRHLLENALKFTHQGAVELRVSYEQHSAAQFLQFTFSDTGVGIAVEHHRQIFEMFHQVDGSAKRCTNGVGLGLSICQRVVSLLNGSIELQSQVEQGARFSVRVPLASMTEKRTSAAPSSSLSASSNVPYLSPLQGQRVLLLDTDMRSLYRMAAQLDAYGFLVRFVGDTDSAACALHEQDFDALMIGVPETDCAAFAALIEQCLIRDIPVFAILDNTDEASQVLQAGFSDTLAKPFDAQLLLELLRHHLPVRRQHA